MFEKFETNVWTHEEPLRFFGFETGRIMTVIRLSSSGLFIQSPASNLHGHLHMEQYAAAYPDVELLAAPASSTRDQR